MDFSRCRVVQRVPGSGHCAGPSAPAASLQSAGGAGMHTVCRASALLQHGEPEAACLLWDSLTIRAVLGALLPAGIQLLSPSSGQRGLDVALRTLLVEAGSGGCCGQRWPSPRPGLDRGWRGQRNAKLWQNSLYKASPQCL